VPLTLIWIVGLTNAVNFIDGLDGLAAGVSTICALCLMALCIISGQSSAIIFTAAIAGACLGFLPRNFNPAEIIMGDTGATFLGYILAVSSIIGVYKNYALLSVALAVLALALPILDTAFTMARRAINGKNIMKPDRGHLHHKLIDMGFSHKQAVLILYILSAIAGVISILIAMQDFRALLILLGSLLLFLLMVYFYRKRLD
jgi:UDP-GlcNAc:undecaprenyl-phosphate GlcNAc-1-phosphate transferase